MISGLREPPCAKAGVAILTEKKDGKAAPGPNYITVGRNLAMELVRVTEVSFCFGSGSTLLPVPCHSSLEQRSMYTAQKCPVEPYKILKLG